MKNFAEKVKNTEFAVNEKGQLKQNVRNEFKADVMAEVEKLFAEAGLTVFATENGLAVEFENVELGNLTVVFDGTVKGLEFDAVAENEAFVEKQAEKVEKALKAEKLKAEKIAEKEFLAKQKAEKKVKATK